MSGETLQGKDILSPGKDPASCTERTVKTREIRAVYGLTACLTHITKYITAQVNIIILFRFNYLILNTFNFW